MENNNVSPVKQITGEMVRSDLCKYETRLLPLLEGNRHQFLKLVSAFSFALIEKGFHEGDKLSIFKAFKKCCELNLDPASSLGKLYLIKYKGEVVAQIGYQGWLDLIMRRTDIVSNVYANIVYEGDEFSVEYTNDVRYSHIPRFKTRTLWLTYAVVKFINGDIQIEVANIEDIEKSRLLSKGNNGKDTPSWSSHYKSMARIVPLRRLVKNLALSVTTDDEFIDDKTISQLMPPPLESSLILNSPVENINQINQIQEHGATE